MPIYTKTGDKGETSLFDGTRVAKNNYRVNAYGTIDELNSFLGLSLNHVRNNKLKLKKEIITIQHDLFAIGSALATPHPIPVSFLPERIKNFEDLIDDITKKLPPLSNFILPNGMKSASLLHICRTITRRAERETVGLSEGEIDMNILIYLNRLSDLLFVMARYMNHQSDKRDTLWKKR